MSSEKSSRKLPTVPERLKKLGALHQERGKIYGNDYKHIGKVYAGMFPRGLTLMTPEEFGRFSIHVMMTAKMCRYAQNMVNGGHADSLDDITVYAQMQRELDHELHVKAPRRQRR